MANTNNNSPRQTHVSPGIYTKETDLTFASKSLGITTLGVVGETLRGPAFQPMLIENWRQFQTFFGGTSVEKYKGSKYPKYELPYIAQSYLQQSNQLQVVRVLGLSGTNAGTAWLITASGEYYDKMVIAVIRSRGTYQKVALVGKSDDDCEEVYEYDKQLFYAKDVRLEFSSSFNLDKEGCSKKYVSESGDAAIDVNNYGKFILAVKLYDDSVKRYAVSLNPNEKDYIYNVIGGNPEVGSCEVYIEELYDVALQQLVASGALNHIDNVNPYGEAYSAQAEVLPTYKQYHIIPKYKAVNDLLTQDESTLRRKDVGKRFLYSATESVNAADPTKPLTVHVSKDKGQTWESVDGTPGTIYTVIAHTDVDGTRKYYYGVYEGEYVDNVKYKHETLESINTIIPTMSNNIFTECVHVVADNLFYIARKEENSEKVDVEPITLDLNNYKEQYRCATTPWVVSEIKGSSTEVELTKLFRFHTNSDGSTSNTEVKVSIENIDPEYGQFDVVVRDFNDNDGSPIVLERYNKCTMVPGNKNYIALRIGSYDEQYETVSKYITVEVNETEIAKNSIPAGFLGYPIRNYKTGTAITENEINVTAPYLQYNTYYDNEIRASKQYFGLSSIVGIDTDLLKYKGVEAYNELPDGLTPCFHLDARIFNGAASINEKGDVYYENDQLTQTINVDGITGYEWVTVDKTNVTEFGIEPRIGSEETMLNTIYEDKKLRKFTMAFYGGWDGWDYYRSSRTNTDDFKYSNYKGTINKTSGNGTNFSVIGKKSNPQGTLEIINNVESYGLNPTENAITSDWYAYLSGVRQFANPKEIDINVLATPGIDYVNNKTLVDEVIDMVENERADAIYVVTTPDKPFGANDTESEMYNADEAVWNLEDSDIDSNYTCTYYPWVKYYDENNASYIYLPPTKDVVRNFAYTDNTAYPWFAAAGWNRGGINGVRPKKSLKLAEQDTLYAGRINFINTFAQEGMKIWGDNNLQVRESQMNKISKRRLLLRIRKLCSIACIGLLFDPNDNTTKQRFQSTIEPIMNDIMSNRGITNWKMEIDDSVEARDRLELPARIFLKPTPNLEYITIDFVITPQGSNWDNV